MKMPKIIQKMMKDFLLIFASIVMMMTILRQLYFPDTAFDLKEIYVMMAFSFISALLGFIKYSPHDLSEKQMRIRMVIHFGALELLLIALASVFDLVNSATDAIILALQIAVIYIIVRLLSWKSDKKEAQKINEKLQALKKETSIKS